MDEERVYQHLGLGRIRVLQQGSVSLGANHFQPPANVYETEDSIVVTVEVAGLEAEAYEVSLLRAEQLLTVSGRRQLPVSDSRVTYHRLEIPQGTFLLEVYLPKALADAEEATAVYEDGFLVITLPKARLRSIPVQATQVADE